MAFSPLKLCLLFVSLLGLSQQQQFARVQTKLGAIWGTERTSETGRKIYSFSGIPYMKPPTGELRFKPPVDADPFKDDFYATNEYTVCAQNVSGYYFGTEDCTILNVYTPSLPSASEPTAKPLPVMVFFSPGSFLSGSTLTMVAGLPDYLLENDVILVNMNYRVGVMGFLSTGDEEAPGNYGLLDQVQALKWVKNNIAAFGGDPDSVTIFGQNAGAISVHYLMMSPLAEGLFHKAIIQSGTSLSPWGRTTISGQESKILAERVGCPTSSSSELLKCLRGKSTKELVNTDIVPKEERINDFSPAVWLPRIDIESKNPFLPAHPIELMRSGRYSKVPLLIGHTKDEFVSEVWSGSETEEDIMHFLLGLTMHCSNSMDFKEYRIPEEKGKELCEKIQRYYIKPRDNEVEDLMQYVRMFNDMSLIAGTYKSIELMSLHSPVYSYSFNYANGHMYWLSLFSPNIEYDGDVVLHQDDLLYLFKYPDTQWTTDSPAYEMVQMMTKAWTGFAKTGKPVMPKLKQEWPQASSSRPKYVAIDTQPTVKDGYRPGDMEFMSSIFYQSSYSN